jgi:hypothetical protein
MLPLTNDPFCAAKGRHQLERPVTGLVNAHWERGCCNPAIETNGLGFKLGFDRLEPGRYDA